MTQRVKNSSKSTKKTLLADHVATLEQLANIAAEANCYGLQDVCLLIVESLNEHKQSTSSILTADLDLTLKRLPALVDAYLQHSAAAAEDIVKILCHPDLPLPLVEDEFLILQQVLISDIEPPDTAINGSNINNEKIAPQTAAQEPTTETLRLETQLITLDNYANQAANKEQYGLQDVCLLVIDSLQARQHDATVPVTPELLALLDNLIESITTYQDDPLAAAPTLLATLGHSELNISMTDDELMTLHTLLTEGIVTPISDHTVDTQTASHTHETQSTPIPNALLELITLLTMQAHLIAGLLANTDIDTPSASHLEQIHDELDRYSNVSKIAGFMGLAQIVEHVQSNVNVFYQNTFTTEDLLLLQDWISLVKDYLANITDDNAGLALISQLSDPLWPIALTPESVLGLLTQLRAINPETDATVTLLKRQQFASDDDTSLHLPNDVNQELLSILLQELPTYTQEFSHAIRNLQSLGRPDDLDIAQRIAHTLKGSANTVGIKGIAVLTHHLEDILEACAKAHQLPNNILINVLIDASDCLEEMSDFLINLNHEPPVNARQILQEVLDWANRIDEHGLPENKTSPYDQQDNSHKLDAAPIVATHSQHESTPPTPTDQTQQNTVVRVPSEHINELLRLSGESLILNTQANERLRRIKNQLLAMDSQFKILQRLSDELEQLIDIKDLTGRTSQTTSHDFDSLEMDQYNELHTTSRRLVEAAFDAQTINIDAKYELEQMSEILDYQQRLVIDTNAAILQTRLIPVDSIASRLQRNLRQTCRLTGKQCELTLSGGHLLIDGDVLNSVIDPLMHILRNSVDHGIENEDERITAGKSPVGHIRIDFDREGNNIVIRCQDDGRGLNFAAIRNTAEEQGVISVNQFISEDELKRFILRPNFSTRTESTQTSGRGVGMNAVNFQVLTLGGSLTLHSQHGLGLTVELRMPLPISRSHALLATANTYRVAITSKGLKQILYVPASDFITIDTQTMLPIEGETYPVISLNRLLHVSENRKKNQRHSPVLLVQTDEKTTAIVLDSIEDSLDIVIKDFGYYFQKIPGYIGAAIMGDGNVAPVIDLPELIRLSATSTHAYIEPVEMIDPASLLPKVLVVDDSLSQRRSLEQLLSDAGFTVYIARDGMEAIELLSDFTPDIMLTDLEMPRMNGIELAAHIRTQSRLKALPIIMITSRTTQKHTKMAEEAGINFYLTKPVREDDLLTKIQSLL